MDGEKSVRAVMRGYGATGNSPIFSVNAHLQKVHFYLWDYIFLY